MNLYNLLQTSLMINAKVICCNKGLSNEVTWCAPDTSIKFENWIMPGLLLLFTGKYKCLSQSEYFDLVLKAKPSGIVLFGETETGNISKELTFFCNTNNIPLISIPPGITILSFSKRFASFVANKFNTEYCQEEWLYNLCHSGYLPNTETFGEIYGYFSEYSYYCLLISIREVSENDPIQKELSLNKARELLSKFFSPNNDSILSFITDSTLVAFVPWAKNGTIIFFRDQVISAATKIRNKLNKYSWRFTVGAVANSLTEFNKSYCTAKQTANIIVALGVYEKVNFYNDWYMHMLLLKEPPEELRIHMNYTLEPILNTPELLETLSYYLIYGENLKITAEKLFIHINTLKYRLHRISELLGCDLKDPNIRFRLRMAITIERYLRNN